MSLRRLIVEVDASSINVVEFCRSHGVSRWFFYDLRRRVARDGKDALEPRSRAPRTVANRTSVGVEEAIVAKRKELVDGGLDAGAETIAFELRDLDGVPSTSTIWRILKARGFIDPEPAKAPRRSGRRFVAERANELWQLDDTGWELADGTGVKILNVIDDSSRLLTASQAMPVCTGARALDTVAGAANVLGWPARVLSDNAPEFSRILADALGKVGVANTQSSPYHPQTCGKVERFHQTLKQWLAKQPAPATLDELQDQLDCFRHLYNHQRAHTAIGRRVPADAWTDTPKDGPAAYPLGTPTRIYRGIVRDGRIDLSGRWRIGLGVAHDTKNVLAVVTGTACHVFANGELIRHLTIDPTRKYQPLHTRPGRPSPTVRDVPRHQ